MQNADILTIEGTAGVADPRKAISLCVVRLHNRAEAKLRNKMAQQTHNSQMRQRIALEAGPTRRLIG